MTALVTVVALCGVVELLWLVQVATWWDLQANQQAAAAHGARVRHLRSVGLPQRPRLGASRDASGQSLADWLAEQRAAGRPLSEIVDPDALWAEMTA